MATQNKKNAATEDCGCNSTSLQTDSISGPQSGIWQGSIPPPPYDDEVPVASVGLATSWGDVEFALDGATTAQIQFNNQFNSYIQGINNWNIGYLDGVTVDDTNPLSNVSCAVIQSTLTAVPVGNDNAIGWDQGSSAPGYYTYVAPGNLLSIFRYIAVYKYCDDGSLLVYVIQVTNLISDESHPDYWTSGVEFSYKCFKCEPLQAKKKKTNNAHLAAVFTGKIKTK